jgi:NAD-dependent SIR2 family protein deacetylase
MSSTTELIETLCPRCGESYAHWERQTLESVLPPSCPYCGHDPATDRLIHEDGIWSLTADEEERAEH